MTARAGSFNSVKGPAGGKRWWRRVIGAVSGVLVVLALGSAVASADETPPVFRSVDQNGVDLARGSFALSMEDVSIGQAGAGGLAFVRTFTGASWRHSHVGTLNQTGSVYTLSIGASSETFTEAGGVFTSDQARGATLTYSSGTGIYTYTSASGAVALFDAALADGGMVYDANKARITQLTLPSGERTTYHYKSVTVQSVAARRLQSVTNNLGYQLHFEYSLNNPTLSSQLDAWKTLTKVTAINNAVDFCDPTADTCGLSGWPTVTYALSGVYETVTDALSGAARLTFSSGRISALRRPSSTSSDHVSISYYLSGAHSGRVSSVSDGTGTWSYSYTDSGANRYTTVTDPLSHARTIVSVIATGVITSDTDALSRATSYTYDSSNRLTRVTLPEGNYTQYTYDSRGNVTQTQQVAKSGSGLATITTSATYPSSCSNQITCNQPTASTDARGYTTDYTYDSTHGGVLTITAPDPDGGGSLVRPQTRFSYDDFFAYYKNSGGSIVAAATPVWRPIEVSACATTSSCAGGSDETEATIVYGSTGVANNLLPTSITAASGNGTLTSVTTLTYDNVGNQLTADGPLSGTADTVRTYFDLSRQVTGIVGPDPDGGGSLRYRAARTSYNADGQVTVQEIGSVTSGDLSVAPASWTTFQSLQKDTRAYNFLGQAIRVTAEGRAVYTDSWSTSGIIQQNYYANGLPECSTFRMNSADFGGGTAACTQGTGGADRITRTTYTNADEVSVVTTGYGTAAAAAEQTLTYSSNGRLATIADANGSLTTNEYDGFDRLIKQRFPNPSSSGSSTTDYEQATYDAYGMLTQQRRRDGATVTIAYDNLGRVTTTTPSANGPTTTNAYDNFGRVLTVSASSRTLTYAYDQLSRLTSETHSVLGAVSYLYDAAGQRTRMTWPDALYVNYDIDVAGAVTAIRENGASSGAGVLATYVYDNLGRRTSVTRGNGTTETYSYDTESRLSSLAQDLASTTHDQTLSYSYNEASQILTRAGTNTSYQWSPLSPSTVTYADNNLNQYTSVGGTSYSYDSRGNLTSDGTNSYTYDIYNRLITGPSSATLAYDPAGRLYETVGGGVTTRFLYDGVALIGEFNTSGTLLRRYVHGPGIDEPIVWYEGSGTSDRRWLIANELGTIIAVTNSSGVATAINSYDEYGAPASGNTGRFQYTGQTWLPEVSLYHYKARVYAPKLGRFMQTDPIGFDGGMNLYGYVGNDPVNFTDPLGLQRDNEPTIFVQPQNPCAAVACITQAIDIDAFFRAGRILGGEYDEAEENEERFHANRPTPDAEAIIVTAPRVFGQEALFYDSALALADFLALVRFNQALGLEAQQFAREYYEREGLEVWNGPISVRTSLGWRYPDLAVRFPGGRWNFVEVKANFAIYGGSQLAKDQAIANGGFVGSLGPLSGPQGPTPVWLVRVCSNPRCGW